MRYSRWKAFAFVTVLIFLAAARVALAQGTAAPAMSVCQARQAVKFALERVAPAAVGGLTFDSTPSGIAFNTGQLEFSASPFSYRSQFPSGVYKVDLKSLGEVTANRQSNGVYCDLRVDGKVPGLGHGVLGATLRNTSSSSVLGFVEWYSNADGGESSYQNCQAFAEGMNTLRLYARTYDASRDLASACLADKDELRRRQDQRARIFAEFQPKAAAWSALATKPPISDDVKQHRLLAEDAYQEKQFETAVSEYEAGLAIDPLWAQGHFNAALIYGELKDYDDAVWHMRCYLELMPNAPDAQEARDQMLLWQGKAKQLAAAQ
ncbi:MAG: hypothetical protein ABSG32_31840 [Terriglobia bacterium]|jgi:hypothetical protein